MGVVVEQIRDALDRIEQDIDLLKSTSADSGYLYNSDLDKFQALALRLLTTVSDKKAEKEVAEKLAEIELQRELESKEMQFNKDVCWLCGGLDQHCRNVPHNDGTGPNAYGAGGSAN